MVNKKFQRHQWIINQKQEQKVETKKQNYFNKLDKQKIKQISRLMIRKVKLKIIRIKNRLLKRVL